MILNFWFYLLKKHVCLFVGWRLLRPNICTRESLMLKKNCLKNSLKLKLVKLMLYNFNHKIKDLEQALNLYISETNRNIWLKNCLRLWWLLCLSLWWKLPLEGVGEWLRLKAQRGSFPRCWLEDPWNLERSSLVQETRCEKQKPF